MMLDALNLVCRMQILLMSTGESIIDYQKGDVFMIIFWKITDNISEITHNEDEVTVRHSYNKRLDRKSYVTH